MNNHIEGLFVDREHILDSEIMNSGAKEIPSWQKKQFILPLTHGNLHRDTRQAYGEVVWHKGFDVTHFSNSLRQSIASVLHPSQSINFNKYLSCGKDTEFCAVRDTPYLYKNFAHSILSKMKKSNWIEDAFKHTKKETFSYYRLGKKILPYIVSGCTSPICPPRVKNISWNNFLGR
jgi:hypothetical protein